MRAGAFVVWGDCPEQSETELASYWRQFPCLFDASFIIMYAFQEFAIASHRIEPSALSEMQHASRNRVDYSVLLLISLGFPRRDCRTKKRGTCFTTQQAPRDRRDNHQASPKYGRCNRLWFCIGTRANLHRCGTTLMKCSVFGWLLHEYVFPQKVGHL